MPRNNSFVWNEVGLWNGSIWKYEPEELGTYATVGVNLLIVLNNVFDSSTPVETPASWLAAVSGFEGVDSADRTVILAPNRQGQLLSNLSVDSNAYAIVDPQRQNRGDVVGFGAPTPYSWPKTKTRGGVGSQVYSPRVPIEDFTQPNPTPNSKSSLRQILWISDVFRLHPSLPGSGGYPWLSWHDFRIAPMARRLIGPTAETLDNPLINAGTDFGWDVNGDTIHHGSSIQMQNLLAISYSPGLPPVDLAGPPAVFGAEDATVLNCWDDDCDGFGNRRVAGRKGYPVDPLLDIGYVDLGADESGELTISGYLPSTRIFSHEHEYVVAATAGLVNSGTYYFFNRTPGTTYFRPWHNFVGDHLLNVGLTRNSGSEWYAQIAQNPYPSNTPVPTGNYTGGSFDNRVGNAPHRYTWYLVSTQTPQAGFNQFDAMRNLACDHSPHLFRDIPPAPLVPPGNFEFWWWGEHTLASGSQLLFQPYFPWYEGIFQSNPWYHCKQPSGVQYDNPRLYTDPSSPSSFVTEGEINPPITITPGTQTGVGVSEFLFADGTRRGLYWLDYRTTPTNDYTVDAYGVAVGEWAPFDPLSQWHGVRYNCELVDPFDPYWGQVGVPHNNLQTFLVVLGDPGSQSRTTTPRTRIPLTRESFTGYASATESLQPGTPAHTDLTHKQAEMLKRYLSNQ